jgi:hypothetical protein
VEMKLVPSGGGSDRTKLAPAPVLLHPRHPREGGEACHGVALDTHGARRRVSGQPRSVPRPLVGARHALGQSHRVAPPRCSSIINPAPTTRSWVKRLDHTSPLQPVA